MAFHGPYRDAGRENQWGCVMSILRRIQRIASAELHDLLEHLDPSADRLNRSIQELETEWRITLEKAADVKRNGSRLSRELEDVEKRRQTLEEMAKTCLRQEQEAEARRYIENRLELDIRHRALLDEQSQNERLLDRHRRELVRLRRRLVAIQRKLESVRETSTSGGVRRAMETLVDRLDAMSGSNEEERTEIDLEIEDAASQPAGQATSPSASLAERLRHMEIDAEIKRLQEELRPPAWIEAEAEWEDAPSDPGRSDGSPDETASTPGSSPGSE